MAIPKSLAAGGRHADRPTESNLRPCENVISPPLLQGMNGPFGLPALRGDIGNLAIRSGWQDRGVARPNVIADFLGRPVLGHSIPQYGQRSDAITALQCCHE